MNQNLFITLNILNYMIFPKQISEYRKMSIDIIEAKFENTETNKLGKIYAEVRMWGSHGLERQLLIIPIIHFGKKSF